MATANKLTENKNEVVLHYIDKCHNLLVDAGKAENSVILLLSLFAFLVVTLASGIVSADQKISLIGLNITIPPWLLLAGGSTLVGSLFVYLCCIESYAAVLGGHIRRLYSSIGFEDESLTNKGIDVALDASIVVIIGNVADNASNRFKKIIFQFGSYLAATIWVLIPLMAEGFAGYRMITLYSWAWLIYFIPLLLITIGYLITMFID